MTPRRRAARTETARPATNGTTAVSGVSPSTERATAARARRVPERVIQRQIVQALRTVGAAVYVLGTVRPKGDRPGTMQTAGIPDLYVLLPEAPRAVMVDEGGWSCHVQPAHGLWVEVKAKGGRLRPQQAEFASLCGGAGVPHLVGGLDVVLAYLEQHGYIREAAHYRRPA